MTGLPILHCIRNYYGGIASGFCGVALFLSCFFFTLGNITGTGAGVNLIFGINWRIGALIMLGVLAAAEPLVFLLGSTDTIAPYAQAYIRYLMPGVPFPEFMEDTPGEAVFV